MMMISLSDAGKRFNRDWIFRHFTYQFENGNSYAITGPNGSGKSTLLQVLGCSMMINEGKLDYSIDTASCGHDRIYQYMSICAPYLELIEEMTLVETLDFHKGFKPFIPGIQTADIISILGLERARNKQLRYYSSGMRQRVKLAQCIFSNVPLILLDEPCTNLDKAGIDLYHSLINSYCRDRLVVVSSNDEVEYSFCSMRLNIADYK
jgi:ABC-type multidrug transport system ATPase subunit